MVDGKKGMLQQCNYDAYAELFGRFGGEKSQMLEQLKCSVRSEIFLCCKHHFIASCI